MDWKIVFARSSRGRSWVLDYIAKLHPNLRSRINKQIRLLKKYGPDLGFPFSKKITPDLYELRIVGKIQIRILYVVEPPNITMLHILIKKSQRLNKRDIITAEMRRWL